MNSFPNEPGREIDLWHVRLSWGGNASLLSPDERARAERFRLDRDRERFVACRSALRMLLAGCLAVPPEEIVFAYGPHGKPYLRESNLKFNVSHSGDEALIVVAKGREVGVDIEERSRVLNVEMLAGTFLTQSEREFFESQPRRDRGQAFLRCWTRKEAWAKAVGTGIAEDPLRFDVGNFVQLAAHSHFDPRAGIHWTSIQLDVAIAWIGALVVEGVQPSVRLQEFTGAAI